MTIPKTTRALRVVAALLGAATVASGGAPVPATSTACALLASPSVESPRQVMLAALRSLRDPDAPPPAEQAPALVERGVLEARSSVRYLFDVLVEREVPADPEDESSEAQILSEVQRELVLELLAAAEREVVLDIVGRLSRRKDSVRAREAVIWVLGAVGGPQHADDLVAVGLHDDEEGIPARLREPWVASMARLMARHDAVFVELNWRKIDESLLTPLLRAVGQSRNPRGLELIAGVLPWKPELAKLALAQVQLLGPSMNADLNEAVCGILRGHLEEDDPITCQAAAHALGKMLDADSIPDLLELLESERPAIRESAHWALRTITGASYPEDPRLWHDWYRLELEWRLSERPKLVAELQRPQVYRVLRALRKLGAHPWDRHEISEDVAPLLTHALPDVRKATASLLGELRSPVALEPLVDSLSDRDESVQEASWSALCAIAGEVLPRSVRELTDHLYDYL